MQTQLPPSPWLVRPQPRPQARLRLFCFPYAGGGSVVYRPWATLLPPEIEVVLVLLPGREQRLSTPPFTHLAPLVNALATELAPHLERPYAFYGHSMGTLLSFELAHTVRQRALPAPRLLCLGAHRAPHLPDPNPAVHTLPEAEFVARLRLLNGTPTMVLENPDLMQLLLPTLRADFAVCETYAYTPRPPLECPLSVFGGLTDSGVPRANLEAWQIHTNNTFTLRMLPGDHFFLHSAQALLLPALARELLRIAE